jgi:hypothetical protein
MNGKAPLDIVNREDTSKRHYFVLRFVPFYANEHLQTKIELAADVFHSILLYYNGHLTIVQGVDRRLGLRWKIDSTSSYNPAICKAFYTILLKCNSNSGDTFGDFRQLKYFISTRIIDKYAQRLIELSAIDSSKELSELQKKLEIKYAAEGKVQTQLPDSIVMYDYLTSPNSHNSNSKQEYYTLVKERKRFSVYYYKGISSTRLGSIRSSKIATLIYAMHEPGYQFLLLENYGYDDAWIRRNGQKQFKNIKGERYFWTQAQKDLIKKTLSSPTEWKIALSDICHEKIDPQEYRHVFKASVYYKGQTNFKELVQGRLELLWKIDTSLSFSPDIHRAFCPIVRKCKSFSRYSSSSFTYLKYCISQRIFDKYRQHLKDLIASDFTAEISELQKKFTIVHAADVNAWWYQLDRTIEVALKPNNALPNAELDLYLEWGKKKKLYTRDSVLKRGDSVFHAVQDIPFIKRYLLKDTSRRLYVNFVNGSAMNETTMYRFNGRPSSWRAVDEWAQKLKNGDSLKLGRPVSDAIARKTHWHCGCNFRLNDSLVQKGIYFTLKDINGVSDWILLPDSTVVLWSNEGYGGYIYSNEELHPWWKELQPPWKQLQGNDWQYFPCRKLTREGVLIK